MRRLLIIGLFWMGIGMPSAQAQFVGCPNIQQIDRVECEALVQLYELANGINWFDNTGWVRRNQPCNWFGVTCNVSAWPRKVTGIRLINNNVGGPIPAELGLLTELRELTIDNSTAGLSLSRLFGTIPSGLGDLEHLEILQLGTNALGGGVPPELGRLKNLKVLSLSNNELKGNIPFELGNLTQLQRLDLSQNLLERSIPPELGQLDSLQFLDVSNNRLSGPLPETLGNLLALETLDVSHNGLDGPLPVALSRLDRLFRLVLSDNQFSGILPPKVARLGAATLNCTLENNAVSLCIPANAPYSGLGKTDICGLPLDDDCRACAPNDASCQVLAQLYTQTEGLDWSRDAGWLASPAWCAWEGVTCTGGALTALALPGNTLAGPLPEALGEEEALAQLDLSGNALTGAIPEAWAGLTGLTTLDLSNNQLNGVVPLPFAEVLAATDVCNLSQNEAGLCVPDLPSYQALGQNPICGLTLQPTCEAAEVAFATFRAEVQGTSVTLNWTLNAPLAVGRFDVQQKQGAAFITADQVPATGEATYQYRIEQQTGVQTYRVIWAGPGGETQSTSEVEVLVAPSGLVVEPVYPQPLNATASLRFAVAQATHVRVHLYDALGRQMRTLFEGPAAGGNVRLITFHAAGLAPGWYVARVETAEGSVAHQTVMVVR